MRVMQVILGLVLAMGWAVMTMAEQAPSAAIEGARMRMAIDPDYPDAAFHSGIGGQVTVGFTIDKQGFVQDINILSPLDDTTFHRDVTRVMRKWIFYPARIADECRNIPQSGQVTFNFAVENGKSEVNHEEPVMHAPDYEPQPLQFEHAPARIIAGKIKRWDLRWPSQPDGQIDGKMVEFPKIRHANEPKISRVNRSSRMEGYVVIQMRLDDEGVPHELKITDSGPEKWRSILEEAAVKAVQQWRYRPYTEDGKALSVGICQAVDIRVGS